MSATTSNTSSERSTIVAVAQMCSGSNKALNLADIAKCAGWAKQQSAQILFLPEACGFVGESAQQTMENAEQQPTATSTATTSNPPWLTDLLKQAIQNPDAQRKHDVLESAGQMEESPGVSLLDGLQTIAQESHLWISAGGVHVSSQSQNGDNTATTPPKVYNTHWILDKHGQLRAEYRKIHLFDVSLPERGVQLHESNSTVSGDKMVLCDESPIGCIGLTTCYDLRFPELYVQLVQRGAQVLLVPSAFTVPTGRAHWHVLLRARAIESQCFVIAAAQYGQHNAKRSSYGHALVVDPWGTVLVDAGGSDSKESSPVPPTPSIVTASIDLAQLDSIRKRMPIQQHRDAAQYE